MYKSVRRRIKGETPIVILVVLGLLALGSAVWFMVSTAPGHTLDNVANLSVKASVPGVVERINLSADTLIDVDGSAKVVLDTYFVCGTATELVIDVTSQEARKITFDSTGNIGSSGSGKLADIETSQIVASGSLTDGGLRITGSCTNAKPIDVRVIADFPPGAVAVPLAQGRYAFGLDLFGSNVADIFAKTQYYLFVRTPKAAVLEDAFGANTRAFNSAIWKSGDGEWGAAYGTFTVPREVATALWWENGILLVVGAIVGVGLDAAVNLARRRRIEPSRSEESIPDDRPSEGTINGDGEAEQLPTSEATGKAGESD